MSSWLEDFSYRIPLGISFFVLAIVGSVAIAWLTAGYRSVRAALANPVKSLRSE
jgi:ABC-type lipoprotein release transport system permease subunit